MAQAAAQISEAIGLQIRHEDPDREEWLAASVATGVPESYTSVLRPLTETVASGNGSTPKGTVEQVTGRPARTFRDFAAASTASWTTEKVN